jgi:uncharacterized membrane protein
MSTDGKSAVPPNVRRNSNSASPSSSPVSYKVSFVPGSPAASPSRRAQATAALHGNVSSPLKKENARLLHSRHASDGKPVPAVKAYGSSSSSGNGSKAAAAAAAKVKALSKDDEDEKASNSKVLVVAFLSMLFVGTGNRIFMKLQTIPMYNYPFFLNMLTTFVYVPACFAYIIPMQLFGTSITPEQRAIPRHKFAVMGLLDAVAGIMGTFAVNYISNASMIVLLQQAAIPISMVISRCFLGARYTVYQYVGASVVIAGIITTLIPTFFGKAGSSGADDSDAKTQVVWSIVQVSLLFCKQCACILYQ